jgi:hypothetical protein
MYCFTVLDISFAYVHICGIQYIHCPHIPYLPVILSAPSLFSYTVRSESRCALRLSYVTVRRCGGQY